MESNMDESYTIKEYIGEKFDEVNVHLSEIKIQTTKTNGRVGSLEKSRTQLWTAVTIIIFMGSAFITLATYALDTKIEKGVKSVLSEYEVQIKK